MAKKKKKAKVLSRGNKRPPQAQGQRGVWKYRGANSAEPDVKVADVSYQNDKLALIIARAWINNNNYTGDLTNHNSSFAKNQLENVAGLKLNNPVVLTETEYDQGWQMGSDDEVVLVLPDVARVNKTGSDTENTLLETAKMLMACVPNGI
jgi:hypothetical protein